MSHFPHKASDARMCNFSDSQKLLSIFFAKGEPRETGGSEEGESNLQFLLMGATLATSLIAVYNIFRQINYVGLLLQFIFILQFYECNLKTKKEVE